MLAFLYALQRGGNTHKWTSLSIISIFIIAILLIVAFLFIESKIKEPLIPLKTISYSVHFSGQCCCLTCECSTYWINCIYSNVGSRRSRSWRDDFWFSACSDVLNMDDGFIHWGETTSEVWRKGNYCSRSIYHIPFFPLVNGIYVQN
jgi:hypothetical protein